MGSENQWGQIGLFLPHWLVLSIKPHLLVHGCSLHLLSNPSFASLAHLQVSAILLIAIACYWLTVTQALSPRYRDWTWKSTREAQREARFVYDWDLNQTWSHSFLGMEIFHVLIPQKELGIAFADLTFCSLIATAITIDKKVEQVEYSMMEPCFLNFISMCNPGA